MDDELFRFPDLQNTVEACLENASDFLKGAKTVLDSQLPNVAYHLAVLALEEIGKSELIAVQALQEKREPASTTSEKLLDDHVKKLFWAIWGPSFWLATETINRSQIESHQKLASSIHTKRLQATYVDVSNKNASSPQDAVSEEEAKNIINLAQLRLKMAQESKRTTPLPEETKLLILWFLNANEDSTKRKLIFGQKSMEKLFEVGSLNKWMAWLKEMFDETEQANKAWAENELNRVVDSDGVFVDKWEVTVRLHSATHSIRPKTLKKWNDECNWIKLYPVNNHKQEVLIQFLYDSRFPVTAIWDVAWTTARYYSVAMSIGSQGFFWWYMPSPQHTEAFYEKMMDKQTNTPCKIKRTPKLSYGVENNALSEEDFERIKLCFVFLTRLKEEEKEPFERYMTALALVSKNDIHLQFEPHIIKEFFACLKSAMLLYGGWQENEDFLPAMKHLIMDLVQDEDVCSLFCEIYSASESGTLPPEKATLEEVGKVKALCDFFFLRTFMRLQSSLGQDDNA